MSTEAVDVKTGEILEEAPVSSGGMRSLVKDRDLPVLEVVETMNNLDWRSLKPHQTALLLMQKSYKVSGGGQMSLNFKQALIFATRCYELGLSPFSSEVWFDPSTSAVNLTLEGRRQLARNKGIDLGPPKFEEIGRDWSEVPRLTNAAEDAKKAGFSRDVGITCRMRVGDAKLDEKAEFTAWLSEWYVGRSPVWKEKPLWMLSVRAQDKCIAMALGTGVSDPISDE